MKWFILLLVQVSALAQTNVLSIQTINSMPVSVLPPYITVGKAYATGVGAIAIGSELTAAVGQDAVAIQGVAEGQSSLAILGMSCSLNALALMGSVGYDAPYGIALGGTVCAPNSVAIGKDAYVAPGETNVVALGGAETTVVVSKLKFVGIGPSPVNLARQHGFWLNLNGTNIWLKGWSTN